MLIRHADGPVLTRSDVPDVPPEVIDPSSVFNPGAVEHDGETVLLLRVQTRGRRTHLMVARSPDGVRFEVEPRLVELPGIEAIGEQVYHVYDPRITRLDSSYRILVAIDTDRGCRLGLVSSDDLRSFRFVAVVSVGDTRNGVLFPERIGGRYLRLERPNALALPGGPTSGDAIVLSESDDLLSWRTLSTVLQGRPRYWDERIGSGPPPLRTPWGWLHLYHGVATHFGASNIYQAGACLLDADDPTRLLARTRDNVLEPRALYEQVGQVPNVVFPSGWVVEGGEERAAVDGDARLRIYYGAADTCVGLASTTVRELVAACEPI